MATLNDVYTARPGYAGGPAGSSPSPGVSVSQQVSAPTNRASVAIAGASSDAGVAPAVSWIVIAGVLVLIHLAWRFGGRPGGSILPIG